MRFSEAFHPYLAVADVRRAEVRGLEGLAYVDLRDGSRHVAGGGPLRFTEVTDREYIQTQAACELLGAAHWRRLLIAKSGSNSTVVWNPWAETATRMPDFGPDEWPGMLCIEPSNAATVDSVTLAPGAAHAMTATISVSD